MGVIYESNIISSKHQSVPGKQKSQQISKGFVQLFAWLRLQTPLKIIGNLVENTAIARAWHLKKGQKICCT